MPGVRFALPAATLERVNLCHRRANGAFIALAVSLLFGGCANQVAPYEPPLFVDSGAPVAVDTATANQSSSSTSNVSEDPAADWSERTYVYRGGRDPKTGLARTQL